MNTRTSAERNPFHNGMGELPVQKFSGRSELLGKLERLIANDWFSYLIKGDRGYGKTSIRTRLKETYAEQTGVLICPVDFGNFRPANSADAYEQLTHRAAQAFQSSLAQKSRKAQIQEAVRKAFHRLKLRIPIPILGGSVELNGKDSKQPSIAEFLKAVYEGTDGLGIDNMVFIFDEISSRTNADYEQRELWAWHFCSDMVTQLTQFSPRRADTKMGVLLLTYPKDIERVPIEFSPDRHLSGRYLLKPFDYTEVDVLVKSLCTSNNVQYTPAFVEMLFRLSGGSPDLIQSIGYGSYRDAVQRGDNTLKPENASQAHVSHEAIIEKAMALVRWKLPEINEWISGGAEQGVSLRQALKRVGKLRVTETNWLTRQEWCDLACNGDEHARTPFTKFLNASIDRDLMEVEENGKRVKFLGEIMRHAVFLIAEGR